VKRRDLIQQIEAMGCVLVRHGGKHDWYQNRGPKWHKQFLVIENTRVSGAFHFEKALRRTPPKS
jgi:hypothetical protein